MDIKSTDRILISGLPGTGKTYFLRYLASLAEPDILIIDPLDQYSMFPDECRYIPKRETPNELEDICKGLMARSNVVLIIEESEQYLSQQRAMLPATSMLIRMGRNWGIGVWGTTRRIQDVNKRFFDLCQHSFFFRCGLKSRDYIADMIGPEFVYPVASPKYNLTGYTITTLPLYHCLHFNLDDETAEIITLKLGAREHIESAGKKSEMPSPQANGKVKREEEVHEPVKEVPVEQKGKKGGEVEQPTKTVLRR